MTSFLPHDMLAVGRLTTSSSNASAILSPVMDDGLSPAAFGGGGDSLSPSPAGFDGTPMFPALAGAPGGGGPVGGYQFGGHHHRGGFGGGGPGGGGMVPYQIATSMPMHSQHVHAQQGLGGEEMVPTTAIDRSGGFGFGGHLGQGGGGGY